MTREQSAGVRSRIPTFKTREEAAEFWDTHDFTEFESEWRPARVKVAEKIQHVLSIPLERDVLTHLIETSRARGIGLDELAARLIAEGLERMRAEQAPRPNKKGKPHG